MKEELTNCKLFNGLNHRTIDELLSSISYQRRKFLKGEQIIFSNYEVSGLYIIIKGCVRGEMTDLSGKTIKIDDMKSSMMLAPAFLFGSNNLYPVDIIANCDTELVYIHKSSFLKLLQLNQTILMNYLNVVSDRAQFLSNRIKFLSFNTIKGKFANYILKLSRKNNDTNITLPLSQSKLAGFFGVTRPALSRTIRDLHNDKIIFAEGKKIKIIDKKALAGFFK